MIFQTFAGFIPQTRLVPYPPVITSNGNVPVLPAAAGWNVYGSYKGYYITHFGGNNYLIETMITVGTDVTMNNIFVDFPFGLQTYDRDFQIHLMLRNTGVMRGVELYNDSNTRMGIFIAGNYGVGNLDINLQLWAHLR